MEAVAQYSDLAVLVILAAIAIFTLVLVFRKSPTPLRDPKLVEDLARANSDLSNLQQAHAAATKEVETLRSNLTEQTSISARLETERNNLSTRTAELQKSLSEAIEKFERQALETQEKHEHKIENQRVATAELQKEINSLTADNGVLRETLKTQKDKHEELKTEIETNRGHFINQFKTISSELLQNQGRATTEAQKGELEKVLSPFKQELSFLKSGLKDMSEKAEKERQSLGEQILLMQANAARLSEEANSLTQALRGDRKRQGNWGETILERILESAGLTEGTHYTKQATTTDEDGKRVIPDIVVHLPGERDVIIDSKVTLVAYQDMIQAGDDQEREEAALKRHVTSMRTHMTSLSKKGYDNLGYDSIDSVMMFLPVEGALSAALTREPDLFLEAADKRVYIMTPSTLMPILKIVDHLWTIDSRNRNVDEIVDRAGRMHDKFVSVVESIEDIGKHLKKASDSQAQAVNRMSEGPGNVLRQVAQLQTMGIRNRKSLATHLVGAADSESEADTLAIEAESDHNPV